MNVVAINSAKSDENLLKLIDSLAEVQKIQRLNGGEEAIKTQANVIEQIIALSPAVTAGTLTAAIALAEHRKAARQDEAYRIHRLANPWPSMPVCALNAVVNITALVKDKVRDRKDTRRRN